MTTDVSNSNTSRRSNPKTAQAWPIKARQVAIGAIAILKGISRIASGIDGHAKSLNAIAEQAIADLNAHNYDNVLSALESIRNATATQRHTAAEIKLRSGDARAGLAAARRGEY